MHYGNHIVLHQLVPAAKRVRPERGRKLERVAGQRIDRPDESFAFHWLLQITCWVLHGHTSLVGSFSLSCLIRVSDSFLVVAFSVMLPDIIVRLNYSLDRPCRPGVFQIQAFLQRPLEGTPPQHHNVEPKLLNNLVPDSKRGRQLSITLRSPHKSIRRCFKPLQLLDDGHIPQWKFNQIHKILLYFALRRFLTLVKCTVNPIYQVSLRNPASPQETTRYLEIMENNEFWNGSFLFSDRRFYEPAERFPPCEPPLVDDQIFNHEFMYSSHLSLGVDSDQGPSDSSRFSTLEDWTNFNTASQYYRQHCGIDGATFSCSGTDTYSYPPKIEVAASESVRLSIHFPGDMC